MSSKLIPTLVLVLLFIGLCELNIRTDWCTLIQPNGTFDGLGIYHRWNSWKEKDSDYVMLNKAGRQWRFEIKGNPGNLKDMEIKMVENSDEASVSDAIHRFGVNFRMVKLPLGGNYPIFSYNCFVKYSENTHKLLCDGWKAAGFRTSNPINFNRELTEFPNNSVLLKDKPHETYLFNDGDVFAVVSKDRNTTLLIGMPGDGADFHTMSFGPSDGPKRRPSFINQMDQKLFQKIDGVVEYNYGGGSGWLLLFNIDGIPKYCFTPENKDLAQECNSSEKMKSLSLFEGCFDETDPTPILLSTPEPTNESDKRKAIKFISVLVIIFLIILILWLLFYCCRNRRKKRRISTQTVPKGQSLNETKSTSIKTVSSKSSSNVTKENKGKSSTKPKPNSNANSSTKT